MSAVCSAVDASIISIGHSGQIFIPASLVICHVVPQHRCKSVIKSFHLVVSLRLVRSCILVSYSEDSACVLKEFRNKLFSVIQQERPRGPYVETHDSTKVFAREEALMFENGSRRHSWSSFP